MQKWSLASWALGLVAWMVVREKQAEYGREESNQRSQAGKWEWLPSERFRSVSSRGSDLVGQTDKGGTWKGARRNQQAGTSAISLYLYWGAHLEGPVGDRSRPRTQLRSWSCTPSFPTTRVPAGLFSALSTPVTRISPLTFISWLLVLLWMTEFPESWTFGAWSFLMSRLSCLWAHSISSS